MLDEEAEQVADKGERLELARDILNEAVGLGPLEYYLADESVSEVMVNTAQQIFVERGGRLVLSLEGGYNLADLPSLVEAHLKGLSGS